MGGSSKKWVEGVGTIWDLETTRLSKGSITAMLREYLKVSEQGAIYRGCNRGLMSFEDKSRGRRSEIAEAIVGGVTCGRWSTIGDLRRALVKFDAIRKVRVEDAIKMIDFVLNDPSVKAFRYAF
jgi:hypothetical protein